jgi:hypothetical protein
MKKNQNQIRTLLKIAEKMKRYHRFRIVHQHYSRSFECKVVAVKKQLPYAPHRELFESIVPYISKGQIPPIIWGGSSFQYNLLRKVGDTFYTHLSEYSCFEKFCCYGDEASEAELLGILNQIYTLGIVFIPTGKSIRAVIT